MSDSGEGAVDLGRLAGAYGFRAEQAASVRAAFAADEAQLGPGKLAIDVGGGTGNHASVFASRGARVLIVDLSPDMALLAQRTGLSVALGDGAALPVASASADLVYFHLSIHHGQPEQWIAEAARVVRPEGLVWVWTLAPEHHRSSFLARWFPSVAAIDERRFPDSDRLAASMAQTGLVGVEKSTHAERITRTAGSWIAAVDAGFVSTLHLLDPAEVARGLAAFRVAHPDPDEVVDYEIAYARVSAIRPSLPF